MREFLRQYTGAELLNPDMALSRPLIQDFLFEEDSVLLVAPPKLGKSILTQQVACALSSGQDFLDTFEVPEPKVVWYFATEGKDHDLQNRFLRMSHGVDCNPNNLVLFCSAGFRFNTKKAMDELKRLIDVHRKNLPSLIIVDALYRAVKGSLKNDDVINEFNHTLGEVKDHCHAASWVVHHMKKQTRSQVDGSYFERSDEETYGSAFIQAAVDHTYWLDKCKKDKRDIILKCDTQRSGNIIDTMRLRLTEPDPLHFQIVSKHDGELIRVVNVLRNSPEGLTITNLLKRTKLGRSVAYCVLKELMGDGRVVKEGDKEKVFTFVKELPNLPNLTSVSQT